MKKIFDVLFMRAVCVVMVAAFMMGGAFAAGNGCDNENNGYIAAELALCSTHAYNIGQTTNPTGEQKELMREVIAMKTTFITQQMYKQYEQLESMIRRLKTQLEKAVLTTNLKVASGQTDSESSSGGASYRSENRNIFMSGVSDCNTELTTLKVFECLNSNLTTLYNISKNGAEAPTEVRKQLANDYKVMCDNIGITHDVCSESSKKTCGADDKTKTKITGKQNFRKCLDNMRTGVRKGYEEAQKNERSKQATSVR